MISTLASLVASAAGWSFPNKVNRTTLSRVWSPRAMARIVVRETPYSAVSVAATDKEGVAPLPVTT